MTDSDKKTKKEEYKARFMSILDKLELKLDSVFSRPLTDQELQYFFDRYSHLQVTTPSEPHIQNYSSPKIVKSRSGWAILNYGNAISSSPGKYLYNYAGQQQTQDMRKPKLRGDTDDDDEDGRADIGTLSRQRYLTAEDIVEQAIKNGWEVIHIVDGDPSFIWALWTHAQNKGLTVTGYKFGQEDHDKRQRVSRSILDDQLAKKGIKKSV